MFAALQFQFLTSTTPQLLLHALRIVSTPSRHTEYVNLLLCACPFHRHCVKLLFTTPKNPEVDSYTCCSAKYAVSSKASSFIPLGKYAAQVACRIFALGILSQAISISYQPTALRQQRAKPHSNAIQQQGCRDEGDGDGVWGKHKEGSDDESVNGNATELGSQTLETQSKLPTPALGLWGPLEQVVLFHQTHVLISN